MRNSSTRSFAASSATTCSRRGSNLRPRARQPRPRTMAGKEVPGGTDLFLRAMHEEEAANAAEYALVVSLIALAIVIAMAGLGGALGAAYNGLSSRVGSAL